MIRITEKSLIIEIPSKGKDPLETLSNLQSGIHAIIGTVDFNNSPKDNIAWGINQLLFLLNEMTISPEQQSYINKEIINSDELVKHFNKL